MWKELVILTGLFVATKAQETIFHCPGNNGTKTFDLTCPVDTVIHIKEAIYGRNKWEACLYLKDDCTEKVDLRSECCGRSHCSVTVWKVYTINCTYVTFFRLIYECIKTELSECGFPVAVIPTTQKAPVNTEQKKSVPVTTTLVQNTPEHPKKQEVKDPDNVVVIVASAATVAFLLVAIIATVFLLRRFQWQSEKQCILEFFIGMCKRHPPDGCENPDEERSQGTSNVPKNEANTDINLKKTNNNANKTKNLQVKQELLLTVIDRTIESDKILQEQNLRFCTPDVIPKRPKSILRNENKKTENTNNVGGISTERIQSKEVDQIDLNKYKIPSNNENSQEERDINNDVKTGEQSTVNFSVVPGDRKSEKMKYKQKQTNEKDREESETINIYDEIKCDEVEKVSKQTISDQKNFEKTKISDSEFDYDGGVLVVDDLHLSRLRNDVSVENLCGVPVERSHSYSTPTSHRSGNIMYYKDRTAGYKRPKLLQRFGTNGTDVQFKMEDRTFKDITNSVVSEEPGTTSV